MKILITGGSGYLGQVLVSRLSLTHEVVFTYLLADGVNDVKSFKVDFESRLGLKECIRDTKDVDVVINCAAISQTRICEENKERASKVNIPTGLLESLLEYYPPGRKQPLLIHVSSDQVYDGSRSFWEEEDDCHPVNYYGTTKVLAEQLIQNQWSNFVILRSSLIYGKKCRNPPIPSRFLDFIVQSLRSNKLTTFFSDEYRCPVFVEDIATIIELLISKSEQHVFHNLFNMGGPERLNRVEMAQQVAQCLGLNQDYIVSAESAKIAKAVCSPLDISMNNEKLCKELKFTFTSFSDALSKIYPK